MSSALWTLKQCDETVTIIQIWHFLQIQLHHQGLELNVVLEEKLHGLDILSPDKLSLLFFNKKPFQLKTLSA